MTTMIGQKTLPIDVIRIDGNTQPRFKIHEKLVAEYAANMADGMEYDAPDVHFDGKHYWLSSGFHRYHASLKVKKREIVCNVYKGTVRDAWLHAKQSNSKHGLPLTNEEKRHNVIEMLDDPECNTWKDREIARWVGCSHVTVGRIKKELESKSEPEKKPETKTEAKPGKSTTKEEKLPDVPAPAESKEVITLREQVEALVEENDRLTKVVAGKVAPDPEFAEQTIEDLREENKQLRLEVKSLTISRDSFQAENAQLIKQVKYLTKKLKEVSPA